MRLRYGVDSDQWLEQWLQSALPIQTIGQTPTGQYVLVLGGLISPEVKKLFVSPPQSLQVTPVLDLRKSKNHWVGYLGFEVVHPSLTLRFGQKLSHSDLDIYDQIVTTGTLMIATSLQGPIVEIDVREICPSLNQLLTEYRETSPPWIDQMELNQGVQIKYENGERLKRKLNQNQVPIIGIETSRQSPVRLTLNCLGHPAVHKAFRSEGGFGASSRLRHGWYYIVEERNPDWQVFLELSFDTVEFQIGFSLLRDQAALAQIVRDRVLILQADKQKGSIGIGSLNTKNLREIIEKYQAHTNQMENPYQPRQRS